ncbi:methyl-accepting chemotaxis protein [Haloarcula laminariae]|uniref:methyl-accepting chemotaxis protein n=1 Tax=Haloarcula laminariae TaxID=2961577 RepID=UPI0021C8CFED|nr:MULTISPECIES: methyl-accepting chemotaxis protein [Halomicroarcula]
MPTDRDSPLPSFVGDSYAARLGVALAFAIVVIVAFGTVISAQASSTLAEDVEGDTTALSDTQAAQLDGWLTTARRDVRTTSRLPVFADGSQSAVQNRLAGLVENDEVPPDVVAVHYVNTANGTITASSNEQFVGVNATEQGAPFATDPPEFGGPDDTHVTDPFSVSVVDHPIIAVVSPVAGAENRAIVYMTDLEARTESISNQREGSYTTVVNGDGEFIAHPNVSTIGSTAPVASGEDDPISSLDSGQSTFVETDEMLMGISRLEGHDWSVMVHADRTQAYALADQINSDLVGLILLAVINLGLVGVTIGGSTIASLRRLSSQAEAMADGDLDVDLETTRGDEFGTLYGAFDNMRSNLRAKISDAEAAREEAESAKREAEEARTEVEAERNEMQALSSHLELKAEEYSGTLESAADGDLTARVDTESMSDAMADVGREINATLDALEATIADMQAFADNVMGASDRVETNAERVGMASQQVSQSIEEIFDGATEQSERLQEGSAEMDNLSATAQQVAASAQEVANTSEAAAEVGEDGREAAQEAIAEMSAIDDETAETVREINALEGDLEEIGDIVSVITNIVEQTNMLALNASIEAAHADKDGDGFAVVADEIKGLAEETKEAAADIEDRIERIQSQAGDTVETIESTSERISEGVDTVEEAVDALETIVEYTEEVDTGIQEIDHATEEQARTAQDVQATIDELSSISQQTAAEADTVAGAADDQAASIETVTDSARELRDRAEDLESVLGQFEVDGDGTDDTTEAAAAGDD